MVEIIKEAIRRVLKNPIILILIIWAFIVFDLLRAFVFFAVVFVGAILVILQENKKEQNETCPRCGKELIVGKVEYPTEVSIDDPQGEKICANCADKEKRKTYLIKEKE